MGLARAGLAIHVSVMKLEPAPLPPDAPIGPIAGDVASPSTETRAERHVRRYRTVAAAALGATLFVILWGALVRIEGAGRGCGNHWPLCNGEVLPRLSALNMVIELTHRVTTLAGLLSVAAAVLAFLAFPKGAARATSVLAVFFLGVEGAIGAALVLLDHVADDTSIARGYWMAGHLCNTFVLLGFMLLAVLAGARPTSDPGARGRSWIDTSTLALALTIALAVGVIVVGATGAIAALSDTLFPAKTLADGFAADLSPGAHAFVAVRGLHPFGAAFLAVAGLALAGAAARSGLHDVRVWATRLGASIAVQVGLGVVNLALLAPGPLQLLHLLAADVVWLSVVGLGWSVARGRAVPATAG